MSKANETASTFSFSHVVRGTVFSQPHICIVHFCPPVKVEEGSVTGAAQL